MFDLENSLTEGEADTIRVSYTESTIDMPQEDQVILSDICRRR
jgi:hypothetical protein